MMKYVNLRVILEHIEALLEEHLLGIDELLPDEVEAIKEYEADKRKRQGRTHQS
jgi:hypothetical protein